MSSDAEILARPFADLVNQLETLDTAGFSVDGLTPSHAVRPRSVEELQEIVRSARGGGLALVPWGGGSQMGFGNVPSRYDVAVDLSALDEVLRYDPDDMTMSVQCGCRLAELNRMLDANRQVLPVDATDPERATIGGLTAVGMSGPRRFGYGPLRDLIIGVTVLTADGTIATAGGQVVKNVTGYDMMRLHHGAMGSLGIILSVNLKVIPKPQSERTAIGAYDSFGAADAAAREVVASQLDVTSIVVTNPAASMASDGSDCWQVAVRCEAPPSAVGRQAERVLEHIQNGADDVRVQESTEESEAYWLRVCRAMDQRPDTAGLVVRFGASASRLGTLAPEIINALDMDQTRHELTLDYGSGLAYVRLPVEDVTGGRVDAVMAVGSDYADHASLLNLSGSTKFDRDVFGDPPAGFGMVEALKATFDPDRIFSPGRYMGRL